jgi:lysyl-tRNA synthetase class 2
MSQPWETLADRMPMLRRRMLLTQAVRSFFAARGYSEVETPYAVVAPGEEVHLRAMRAGDKYLNTSPEFAMKKLLAGGSGPIFQLARVWRDEPHSATHAPEFTMLEWYNLRPDLGALMDETEALLRAVLPPVLVRNGRIISLQEFERITVRQAFLRYVGADVLATEGDAPALAAAAGAKLRDSESWEDLFFRLLLERVEPELGRERPSFLTHWPASQAALARRDPSDPRVAERFELFCGGMELANAFVELTDAAEQRARFLEDRARRHVLYGGEDWALDEAFLAAVGSLPPCAGIALGFDRLAMLACGASRIGEVMWLQG